MSVSRRVVLTSRPEGIPQADNFEVVEGPMPEPGPGEVLVRNQWLSVEPAMRGWVSAVANYAEPVPLGGTMRALAAGEIIASNHPAWRVGAKVTGFFGWQEHAVVPASAISREVTETDLPLQACLGILGLNGITAYFAFLDVGAPRPGDTVVVSTAAGSVGSAVGQIAKLMGCRTIGIAGGPEKVRICRDFFGYDAAFDYRAETDLSAAIAAAAPRGVDVYFDNTSGRISDAVLPHLSVGARVVICGTASVASWDPPPLGPRVERYLLVKRARMQGFLAFDYAHREREARTRLAQWIRAGQLTWRETVTDGLETAPGAIAELYRGENLGKRLIRLHS